MSYLVAISIGPVQEFIAASRRTNDLKAGSQLLVDCVKEAVVSLEKLSSVELIFPKESDQAGANKILLRLNGENPCEITHDAKAQALNLLLHEWNRVKFELEQIQPNSVNLDLAQSQVESFLEFYSAWVIETGNYQYDRKSVERLLAGRKALRNFEPAASIDALPKSPLDPARDGVLKLGNEHMVPSSLINSQYRFKTRETLDAISLIKRVNGSKGKNIPSTTLMALRNVYDTNELNDLKDRLEKYSEKYKRNFEDLIFISSPVQLSSDEEAHSTFESIKAIIKSVHPSKKPFPYYAILVADGDKMGLALDKFTLSAGHQQFSAQLSNFALEAKSVVEKHQGYCVYAGGDDVVAFLPVKTAILCARMLSDTFTSVTTMKTNEKLGNLQFNECSLSVGIAIVHHLESLQVSLEYARAAEKRAKKLRKAMAIGLHTRGGQPIMLKAESWNDDPMHKWNEITELLGSKISRGLPYELRELANEWLDTSLPDERLINEVMRIVKRKKDKNKDSALSEEENRKQYDLMIDQISNLVKKHIFRNPIETDDEDSNTDSGSNNLLELANRLILSRFLTSESYEGGAESE